LALDRSRINWALDLGQSQPIAGGNRLALTGRIEQVLQKHFGRCRVWQDCPERLDLPCR
jgi:hypothetical protein